MHLQEEFIHLIQIQKTDDGAHTKSNINNNNKTNLRCIIKDFLKEIDFFLSLALQLYQCGGGWTERESWQMQFLSRNTKITIHNHPDMFTVTKVKRHTYTHTHAHHHHCTNKKRYRHQKTTDTLHITRLLELTERCHTKCIQILTIFNWNVRTRNHLLKG